MVFLQNTEILITLSVTIYFFSIYRNLMSDMSKGTGALLILCAWLLLFLSQHRFGSQPGVASPALQILFLVTAFQLPLVRWLAGGLNLKTDRGEAPGFLKPSTISALFFMILAIFLIGKIYPPELKPRIEGNGYLLYLILIFYCTLILLLERNRTGEMFQITGMMFCYAAVFHLLPGGFGSGLTALPPALQIWSAILWGLPTLFFLLGARRTGKRGEQTLLIAPAMILSFQIMSESGLSLVAAVVLCVMLLPVMIYRRMSRGESGI